MKSIPHSMESILKNYGVHPPFHGKTMESLWKVHGIHLEKVWNLSGKSMESIHHSMESIHQKYGIHPPFHGIHPPFYGIHLEFLQSTPHSMDSIWINLGRVKYCGNSAPTQASDFLSFLICWVHCLCNHVT